MSLRWSVVDHENRLLLRPWWHPKELAWQAIGWPILIGVCAWLVVSMIYVRIASRLCLLCPHHKVVHNGRCGWHFETYTRGAFRPSEATILEWKEAKGTGTGGTRKCPCPLFVGLPWGNGDMKDYDAEHGK